MRSTFLIGCLLVAVVCVHSMTVERSSSIHKRSPQSFQRPYNGGQGANNQTQFQWMKVDNQWVRSDGTKLPGYSQPNVPYNQSANQWNNPGRNPVPTQPIVTPRPVQQVPQVQPPRPGPQGPPSRQNSAVGWNPNADRALTQDIPKTTPRPVTTTTTTTTTQRPVMPHTPPPAQAPFGSGASYNQRQPPNNKKYNPDASLTYGLMPGQNVAQQRNKTPQNTGRGVNSNPWGGL